MLGGPACAPLVNRLLATLQACGDGGLATPALVVAVESRDAVIAARLLDAGARPAPSDLPGLVAGHV